MDHSKEVEKKFCQQQQQQQQQQQVTKTGFPRYSRGLRFWKILTSEYQKRLLKIKIVQISMESPTYSRPVF